MPVGIIKNARLSEVRKHGYVLTPGRYVGAEGKARQAGLPAPSGARQAGGEPFEEKMARLVALLREQQAEAARLDALIAKSLEELGYG